MSRKNPDTQQLDYVGRSIPRKDGPDKVTGRATYTVDIKLPGMLVGRILGSPHPSRRCSKSINSLSLFLFNRNVKNSFFFVGFHDRYRDG